MLKFGVRPGRTAYRLLPVSQSKSKVAIPFSTSQQLHDTEAISQKGPAKSALLHPLRYAVGKPPKRTVNLQALNYTALRDSCSCPRCIDPSTKQKYFQTSEIPRNIQIKSNDFKDGFHYVTWKNDISAVGANHVSKYSDEFLQVNKSIDSQLWQGSDTPRHRMWDGSRMRQELKYFQYGDYMNNDEILYTALEELGAHGLLVIRGVPASEKSVEEIATRIGTIRDNFYGRTWDVKSVPDAKNVAYTHQNLGFHMDLLYMRNPPGLQLLHCLKNSCKGGASIFSDSFYAASKLTPQDVDILSRSKVPYHYENAGEHYRFEHPVIEPSKYPSFTADHTTKTTFENVNFSPPFQAPMLTMMGAARGKGFFGAFKRFTQEIETPDKLIEFKMREGDCVIFNNRRILHGRRAFEAAEGERWLKGTYVDTDVYDSKYRVLRKKFPEWNVSTLIEWKDKVFAEELALEEKEDLVSLSERYAKQVAEFGS